jgi:hypothetical protein
MNVAINLEEHTILILLVVNAIALLNLEVAVSMDSAQIPFQHKIVQIKMEYFHLIHAPKEQIVEEVAVSKIIHALIYYQIKHVNHKKYLLLFHAF